VAEVTANLYFALFGILTDLIIQREQSTG